MDIYNRITKGRTSELHENRTICCRDRTINKQKSYKNRMAKLNKICLDYENGLIEDYLRDMAHNYQLQM